MNFNKLRKEYCLTSLKSSQLHSDPFAQFLVWFREAEEAEIIEPNAMSLATASVEGRPSCRTVLLKGVDEKGFLFFTNYESRKGRELEANPFASVVFHWRELERQVIIEGEIEKLKREESDKYFASRPRGSQLGAWASHQDQVIESRQVLEEAYQHYDKLYEGKDVPPPLYWGGYRLLPSQFEFMQGRKDRMSDRFRYLREGGIWKMMRLSP